MALSGGATRVVPLDDRSRIGEARRAAVALAAEAGLGEGLRSDVGIVATELASNVIRHAERGTLLLRSLDPGGGGIELLVVDGGPGMRDPRACLEDGYSTAGSMGTGLGAVRRLAHGFDLYSVAGRGTVVVARLWIRPDPEARREARLLGGLAAPMAGENGCGDAWAAQSGPAGTEVLLADGLGHGPSAAAAAAAAVEIFRARPGTPPGELVGLMHAGLRSTRGAAVAVAARSGAGELRYAGVGNIGAVLVGATGTRSLMSHNGTVGLQVRKIQELGYPWPPDTVLVMHSDGLMSHWRLDQYPGILQRDPAVVAGVLYRDFTRGRDDVSVVVQRLDEPAVTL